jgi:glycosyltransferase involved in cell wall biosynthesis
VVLVSVIIPCYNQAHFLAEAIESVLAQNHPRFEILVVDDGSTDDTSEVAARYPEVRCLRQENRGLAAARNAGLRSSEGEYVVFLDADDRLLPNALEAGLECFEDHRECALVAGHYRLIAADGSLLRQWESQRVNGDHYLALLRGNNIGMHATVMYRRAVLESVRGFDTSLRACEDYDLYFRVARTFPICHHGKLVAEYRQHDANMTRNSGLLLKSAMTVLRAQRMHVKGNNHYKKAYNAGIEYWGRWYGNPLIEEMRVHVREREWRAAIEGMLVLLRYHPRGLPRLLPARLRRRIQALLQKLNYQRTPVGWVRFGNLRRVTPISLEFGYDRGQPIDRYYIESFLARQAEDIHGRTLEIGDDSYTRRFGGNRVTASDVLHVTEGNPRATIVADLTCADNISSNTFDCIILAQTLHLIYEVRSAIQTIHRILKPGGILLATFPGISQLARDQWGDNWYWAFTSQSARRLFEEAFSAENVRIESHGNVLTAICFLHGLAVQELRPRELDYHDPCYELVITVRAVKPKISL